MNCEPEERPVARSLLLFVTRLLRLAGDNGFFVHLAGLFVVEDVSN
jgi:hypothetical protein